MWKIAMLTFYEDDLRVRINYKLCYIQMPFHPFFV